MKINKKDFIEILFTGRVKNGEIFDSNIEEDLKSSNFPYNNQQIKPLIFPLGQKMFLEAIDEFLVGKELVPEEEYEIELTPDKAFGQRNPSLIRLIPMNVFRKQKLNPHPGMSFNFDGQIARIISVSGGRVIADFNNPLAGKTVVYNIRVKRKVDDINEKINSLTNFLFGKEFKFKIKDKSLIFNLNDDKSNIKPILEAFKNKFKEILGLDLEVLDEKK